MRYQNISSYKFSPLTDLKPLRQELITLCKSLNLKGTILLSTEGINLFVSGEGQAIESLLSRIRQVPGLSDLTPKISESDSQPFTRMLVRIKKEIIAFGVEGIDPGRRTSPKLSAKELKSWLDEGRPVTLLDTRNDYEVKLGTFEKALPIGIKTFRDFPRAVAELPQELKDKPIVMFCTGGIRCEKAGPFMEAQGFKNIFQLDGGILKYFEEVGKPHYQGDCFVFDQRVGVDPSLAETENSQCFVCLTPLTPQEQEDDRYFEGKSCPYCFKSSETVRLEKQQEHQRKLDQLALSLPGSVPYSNYRPFKVAERHEGMTALQFLAEILPHHQLDLWWEGEFTRGNFFTSDRVRIGSDYRVRAGERILHLTSEQTEPEVNAKVEILFEDEAVLVLEKPAPLPVHPSGRFNRNTLQYLLDHVYQPERPRPAHRLDANTTGVLLVARTKHFAGLLQPQFTRGEVEKVYLARVQGSPPDEFGCELPLSDTPSAVGSRCVEPEGRDAKTLFRTLERFSDGTSLVEARPLTGRTNQIRIHLWELGFPICGDPLYLPKKKLGEVQTVGIADKPLELHSYSLTFTHPVTRDRRTFTTKRPGFCQSVRG